MKNWKERKQIIVDLMKNEFYVPMKEKELAIMLQVAPEERANLKKALEELLAEDKATVTVLKSHDQWHGVTYKEDKPVVVKAIQDLKDSGLYPEYLWK